MTRTQNSEDKLPRFNHYVPRFILEHFTQHGKLSIFDKHTLRQFKLPAYRAMGEKDFTNVRIGDSILSFENKFTYIENLAAPVVARIIEQRSLTSLTPMDQGTLHTFVIVQFLRSERRRLDQIAIGLEIKRRWPEVDLGHGDMTHEELAKLSSLEFAFSKLDEFASLLVSKHSYLLIRNCPGELYISDNPMVMHNSKEYGPYGNIGIAVPHIEIYYPLSADIVLAYMCPLTMKETEEAHHAADTKVNSLFSRTFMSPQGISTSNKLQIEKSRDEIRRAKDYYAMLKNERFALINSESLLFLNSLQILSSFRYFASRTSYFSFSINVMSERPH
jgi:hypothetical protein